MSPSFSSRAGAERNLTCSPSLSLFLYLLFLAFLQALLHFKLQTCPHEEFLSKESQQGPGSANRYWR